MPATRYENKGQGKSRHEGQYVAVASQSGPEGPCKRPPAPKHRPAIGESRGGGYRKEGKCTVPNWHAPASAMKKRQPRPSRGRAVEGTGVQMAMAERARFLR